MIDFRIQTFLTLCETMNYTRTAEKLNMTQPAVTQHIHYLEKLYNCKLFSYKGKVLTKTQKCCLLEQYAKSMRHSHNMILDAMKSNLSCTRTINIGATKTIGEYVIGNKISRYLADGEKNISLIVDNTNNLIKMLEDGHLDFAIIEGPIDKNKYGYKLYSKENFIGICNSSHPFSGKYIDLEDIVKETVIVREEGSGTRNILSQILSEHSYSFDSINKTIQISNFSVIKNLVQNNIGISFVYESVFNNDPDISTFFIKDTCTVREFNYIYLKDTLITEEFLTFYNI